jgi:UDP-glucuronate 4-epimerase
MKKILVTGSAGFIGFHLSERLINEGFYVIGLDSLNDYYDVGLKIARVSCLQQIKSANSLKAPSQFTFIKLDLIERDAVMDLFSKERFDFVVHLAAQAGVRYSITNPQAYVNSNLIGFTNLLEACRSFPPRHLLFASSSSVYGLNSKTPFDTSHHTDHPVSLYAATKKANEVIAHSYAHLYGVPMTGLRFFTVYGPWGRPDMAYFSFTQKILKGEPVELFNNGELMRDFTYIDDIVNGIVALLEMVPEGDPRFDASDPDPSISSAPYRLFNIGNNRPVKLMEFVNTLEDVIGIEAKKTFKAMQAGDVYTTYADIKGLSDLVGFKPQTLLRDGLKKFVDWYRDYYKLS